MLKLVEEQEFEEIVNEHLNEEELNRFNRIFTKRANHKDFKFLTMYSEDGKNTLQGLASAEIYETKKGNVVNVTSLFVVPEFRESTNYDEILILHLIRLAREAFTGEEFYSYIGLAKENDLKAYVNNGFDHDEPNKSGNISVYKLADKEILA